MALEQLASGLWCVAAQHHYFGMRIGARMTIVRLPSGTLWLHSPVRIDAELGARIDALGPVGHIVCPNVFHHVYAGAAQARWPAARTHAPAALRAKRKDLRIDADLVDGKIPDWEGVLDGYTIRGSIIRETVFVHEPSRTLVSSDVTENFTHCDHAFTRLVLALGGVYRQVGWSKLLRWAYKDHPAARASIDELLTRDFDRVIVGHGEIIERDGREAIRQTFTFL